MADTLPSRTLAQDLAEEQMNAEAISRRDESMASVHRSRALRNAALPGLAKVAAEATQQEVDSAKVASEAQGKTAPFDLEGTALGLADRTGTFAGDAETARAGGIGVENSNLTGEPKPETVEETAEPAKGKKAR